MLIYILLEEALVKRKDIEGRLFVIFEDIFNLNGVKIGLEIGPKDLKDWDSLGHIRLISAIEEEFKITIPIEYAVKFDSFNMILEYVYDKLSNGFEEERNI
ncbi:MAG: hypothetical protein CMI58_03315 [Parcubacteria group bacterium]|nr:hypothetical protein [Parcubacteria group bacterium]